MNKNVKRYIKEISKVIPISSKDKNTFLNIMQEKITEFCNDNETVTYGDIIAEFGKPNEVAASYIEEMETDILIRELDKKRYIKCGISIIILLALFVSLFRTYRLNQLYIEVRDHQPVEVETTIIEETE